MFDLSRKIGDRILNFIEGIPAIGKLVRSQFRLKTFVYISVLIASYISFNATYLVVSSLYRHAFIKNADKVSDAVAQQMLGSMAQLMERGWTRSELNNFLSSMKGARAQFPYQLNIFRGEAVERDYGPIAQPKLGRNIIDSFRTGDAITYKADPIVINIYPIKADNTCLKCHSHVKVGEVLGVMKIEQDISPALKEVKRIFNVFFFILLPIPFVLAGAVSSVMNAKIKRSTTSLHKKVTEVNSIMDLTKLNGLDITETGFAEFNTILLEFGTFAKRIRNIAVDREVLEFELRVLEKFIITSDVVRDWKEHVMHLLLEINKVIRAYTLFSIFQVDEEIYDLEVFWTGAPTEDIKADVEKTIRKKVTQENARLAAATLKVNHNIADAGHAIGIGEKDIELQTKSVVLQNPQIGGVVGIGVQSEMTKDTIRSLVIEGILTTLLNVVGSVKAIYKYTKDLEYYATRDPLTNLYNQRLFWELLGYEIGRAQRHNEKFSVLVIDLDNFKNINDTHGHVLGDRFLSGIADTIHGSLRDGDILARYGGDEFVVVLPDADEEQAYLVANKVLENAGQFALLSPDGVKVKGTVSIGFAVYPVHAVNGKDLFLFADNMMYKAKNSGKNTILIPTEDDVVEVFRAAGEKTGIVMKAVEEKGFVPYFQPIINIATGKAEGHEVLSRIITDQGVLDAELFIEVAEQLGVVNKLDSIVMEKVFRTVNKTGYSGYLFINLSPKSLIIRDFIPGVLRLTKQYGIDHRSIVFEITERDTVKNISLLVKFVNELKSEGFKFAIDDFGSGFSSFHYIKRLPIDFVKIEGEFIKSMTGDRKNLALVKTMAVLAQEFGIQTIAECVESGSILETIRQSGVLIHYGQGYYLGRPLPEFMN